MSRDHDVGSNNLIYSEVRESSCRGVGLPFKRAELDLAKMLILKGQFQFGMIIPISFDRRRGG